MEKMAKILAGRGSKWFLEVPTLTLAETNTRHSPHYSSHYSIPTTPNHQTKDHPER